jgi:hypothetical protein
VRAAKQELCIREFLLAVAARAAELADLHAGLPAPAPGEPVVLGADYVARAAGALCHVPLRRIDTGEVVTLPFPDHRAVLPHAPVAAPRAWVMPRHVPVFRDLLLRHGLDFEEFAEATELELCERRVEAVHDEGPPTLAADAVSRPHRLPAGTLRVPYAQTHGRVAALLLEPTSTSSVFAHPAYRRLLVPGTALCIHREP